MSSTAKPAVLFDLETCSAADLRSVGGRNYAAHESTRILIGVFLIDGVFYVWLPGQNIGLPCFCNESLWPKQFGPCRPVATYTSCIHPPGLPLPVQNAITAGREFIAHNSDEFDSHIWREKLTPVPRVFGDTIHDCRAAGLPAKLDDLGKRFFGTGKDAGQNIMSKMWTLEWDGNRYHNKHQTPGNIALAARYCIGDVCILEKVYSEVHQSAESNVLSVHRAINNRGVQLDTALARTLIDFSHRAAAEAGVEIEKITKAAGCPLSADDLRSHPKMTAWLKAQGVPMESLRKQNVEAFLSNPEAFLSELEDHE